MDNPIVRLGAALQKLGMWETPIRLNDTTRTYFERLASMSPPEEASRYRALLDPKRAGAVQRYFAEHEPSHYSMLRTSVVPTMLTAGVGPNVIPSVAEATVDIRALPYETSRASTSPCSESSRPGDPIEPLPVARPARPPRALIRRCIACWSRSACYVPGSTVLPSMSTGASDQAQLRAKGIQSYGIAPLRHYEDAHQFRRP